MLQSRISTHPEIVRRHIPGDNESEYSSLGELESSYSGYNTATFVRDTISYSYVFGCFRCEGLIRQVTRLHISTVGLGPSCVLFITLSFFQ